MKILSYLATTATIALTACSSGSDSSGDSVAGLSTPEQMTLVEANGSSASTAVILPDVVRAAGLTDFQSDETEFWVHDDSMQALETVNMILCSIQQTRYAHDSVVNQGPYLALVGCEERGGEQGGQGRSGVEYERFLVDSQRASASSPHVVQVWVETTDDSGSGAPAVIYVKMTITESPSAASPYGQFEMHFKQLLASQSHDDPETVFTGFLQTVARDDGLVEYVFSNVSGDVDGTLAPGESAFRMRARVVAEADGSAGRAYAENRFAYNPGSGTQSEGAEYFLEYDQDYMARKSVGSSSTVEVFDRNSFDTHVYRYGLYDADTEAFVDRLSGFGVETTGGEHGWVGYHGLWFPEHVTVTDGMQLVRRSYDPDVPDQSYSAVVVPGRLEKRVRSTLTLADVKNEELEMFSMSTGEELRVKWTGSDLVKTAVRDSQGNWSAIDPAVSISSNYSSGDWLNLYSPHRGNVELVWPTGGPTDLTEAYVWTRTTITRGSPELSGGDLTLYGYFRMLKSDITGDQANYVNGATPYHPDATNVGEGTTYVFDAETLMLTLAGNDVSLLDGVTVDGGPSEFGLWSGPMFTTQLNSLDEMGSMTSGYEWVTGTNSWNQLRTVVDSDGNAVDFDPPLRLSYTHQDSSDPDHDGKTYMLEWTGTDLHGIPFLEGQNDDRWYPAFNIPTGTTVTAGSKTYKVKQLEGEQTMQSVSNPGQVISEQGFDLDQTLSPPGDDYQDPAIGAKPTVTSPPLFVGGVDQSSS